MTDKESIAYVIERINMALDDIAPLFRPGSQLTFIMHTPGQPNQELIVTTTPNVIELAAVINRRVDEEKKTGFTITEAERPE